MPHIVDKKLTYDLQHAGARATKALLFSNGALPMDRESKRSSAAQRFFHFI